MEVPIFTVALGTDEGFVDVFDNLGRLRRVEVPPDRETLSDIADTTGAEYFEAVSDDQLTRVYEGLSSKIGYDTEMREVTWAFAAIAGLLFLIGAGLSMYWFNRFP
jgi:Ca-activated chloride channel family protein